MFHNGRGSQENIFAEAKSNAGLDVIPSRRLAGNQMFTLCSIIAPSRALPKRPALWSFQKLDTLRHRIIQRAGRLTKPQGALTLTMSANKAVQQDLLHFLDRLRNAA